MNAMNELFETTQRQSYAVGLSVGLHACVLCLMLFNFSWVSKDFEKTPPAILMVDLSKVEVSSKTNLPPKAPEKKKEVKKEVKKEAPKAPPKPKEVKKPETKTPLVQEKAPKVKEEPPKPVQKEAPKEASKVVEAKKTPPKKEVKKEVKKETPKPKATPKPAPKPQAKAPAKTPAKQPENSLQSLLTSVNSIKKAPNPAPAEKESTQENRAMDVNDGIEGGTSGSRLMALTISEQDLIATKVRNHWNVNGGAEGIEKITVELKVFLNKDGSLRDVKIMNMKNDPTFKSIAESAQRAIYLCDREGEESPFRILAKKHNASYNDWKEITLRMNPVEGVF